MSVLVKKSWYWFRRCFSEKVAGTAGGERLDPLIYAAVNLPNTSGVGYMRRRRVDHDVEKSIK
ncbi:MAG: hypothetical protein LBF60_03450 [Treponema sp.]|jgi:hypothetical protein|nr:hypothetical protein [Treponema sp.]